MSAMAPPRSTKSGGVRGQLANSRVFARVRAARAAPAGHVSQDGRRDIIVLDELPPNASGKVMKTELPAHDPAVRACSPASSNVSSGRGLPGTSRTLLTARLRPLDRRGVVERWSSEYHLTPAGRNLEKIVDAFGRWAVEWLFDELYTHEVHPHTLMWWMHRRTDPARFPDRRVVRSGAVDITGPPRLARELRRWFLWSLWAEVTREPMARA